MTQLPWIAGRVYVIPDAWTSWTIDKRPFKRDEHGTIVCFIGGQWRVAEGYAA